MSPMTESFNRSKTNPAPTSATSAPIMTVRRGDGAEIWRNKDGKLHREDGPAIKGVNAGKAWYRDGRQHRDDGPAVEGVYGDKQWWLCGKLHREDGPAIEGADGSKQWYRDGLLHREDGPALEFTDGSAQWYRHGKLIATTPAEAFAVEDQARAENSQRDLDKAEIAALRVAADRAQAFKAAVTLDRLRTQAHQLKLKPSPQHRR